MYLNANVLTDVYEADNETIIITDNVISVKPNVFAFKSHTHSKSDITDFTHTHTESDITDLKDYALNSEVYSKSEVDELIHALNNNIKLNGTSGIIQTGESVELYAYCKADGMPVLNKKVHFFKIEEDE